MSEKRGLMDVLQQRVDRFEGAKALVLTTFDGVELLTVPSSSFPIASDEIQLILQYISASSNAHDQIPKLGLGNVNYIVTWLESGILVQTKFEAAMLMILLSFDANLGIIDDNLEVLSKILQPFTSSNFINSNA